MTWKTGADLSLSGLRALREELKNREIAINELVGWLSPSYPSAARLHEIELDEVRGQLDDLSDEIGRLERDEYVRQSHENLVSIERRYNLSEF